MALFLLLFILFVFTALPFAWVIKGQDRVKALVMLFLVAGGAALIYNIWGQPQYQNIPLAAESSGPSAADMQAAQDLSADERQAMISGMVARLEARLADNPDDLAGWQRLGHSFYVLGENEKSRQAYQQVLRLDAQNPLALFRLGELAVFAKDFQAGKAFWQRLLDQLPQEAEDHRATLQSLIDDLDVKMMEQP